MVNEAFLNSYYMKTLEEYCQKFGRDFASVAKFYEQHPVSAESIVRRRGIKLLDKLELKPVLGMEIEEAIREIENPTV